MNTGLWVLLWVIVALVIMGILLWAANRKPVEKSQESLIDVDALARYPHQNPLDYLADIYPVTGEYPKPLTGIQKEEEAKRAIEEFAAGSTAVPFSTRETGKAILPPGSRYCQSLRKTTLKIRRSRSPGSHQSRARRQWRRRLPRRKRPSRLRRRGRRRERRIKLEIST